MEATVTERKPPYGGFASFWNFVGQLHDNQPLPQRLDRSVMGNRGGSSRSELYVALRFFGLIDEEKAPTDALRELVADPSKAHLQDLVKRRYAPLVELDLSTATPRQVDEALENMGSTPSTVGRSRAFLLHAFEEAGLPVGKTLKTRGTPGTSPTRRRPKQKAKSTTANNGASHEPKVEDTPKVLPDLVRALVKKLPPEVDGWSEDEARQWLALAPQAIAYDYKLDLRKLTEGSS